MLLYDLGNRGHKSTRQHLLMPISNAVYIIVTTIFLALAISSFTNASTVDWQFSASGAVMCCLYFYTIALSLRRGDFLFAMFVLFTMLPPVQVYLSNIVVGTPMIWRELFDEGAARLSLNISFLYAGVLYVSVALSNLSPLGSTYTKPKRFLVYNRAIFVSVLAVISSLALVSITVSSNRNAWIEDASISDRFSVLLLGLAMSAFCVIAWSFRGKFLKLSALLVMVAAVSISLSGFRSVLVSCAVGLIASITIGRRFNPKEIALGIAGAVLIYLFLAFLTYVRSSGINFEILLTSGLSNISFQDVLSYTGRHEQLELYTVQYASRLESFVNFTYLDSVIRVLPNFIHTKLFETVRPQDILVGGAPSYFRATGLNFGAYFFSEAILNFGVVGGLIVVPVTIMTLRYLEFTKASSSFARFTYGCVALMVPTLAYYGSGNFVKQLITLLYIGLVVLAMSRRKEFSGTGNVKAY